MKHTQTVTPYLPLILTLSLSPLHPEKAAYFTYLLFCFHCLAYNTFHSSINLDFVTKPDLGYSSHFFTSSVGNAKVLLKTLHDQVIIIASQKNLQMFLQ